MKRISQKPERMNKPLFDAMYRRANGNQIMPTCACDPQLRQLLNIIYTAKAQIDDIAEDSPKAGHSSVASAS